MQNQHPYPRILEIPHPIHLYLLFSNQVFKVSADQMFRISWAAEIIELAIRHIIRTLKIYFKHL